MRTVLLLMIGFLGSASCQERIFGGHDAPEGWFPYAVSIYASFMPICTGVLIDDNWVLTAAHCIYRMTVVEIAAGAVDRTGPTVQRRPSLELLIHPKYAEDEITGYDFGLVRTYEFDFTSSHIGLAPLSTDWWPKNKVVDCNAVGWGHTATDAEPSILQYLKVTAKQDSDTCPCVDPPTLERIVCLQVVAGKGPCKGDSGGPLVCGGKVVGIAHVIYSGTRCNVVACGQEDTVVAYMFITPELDWIRSHVRRVPATPSHFSAASSHTINFFLAVLTLTFLLY